MNTIAGLFFVCNAAALFFLPRKWAPVPLLIGACYMTVGQGIEVSSVSLPIIRLLLAVGILRVLIRGERIAGGFNRIDGLMTTLAAWMMFASFFHKGQGAGPLFMAGVVFNIVTIYYLFRVFCRSSDDAAGLAIVISIILVPVAIEMIYEKLTGQNLFSTLFGGSPEHVVLRNDRLRARGPFRQAILAGTVAAACFPLIFGIRRQHPKIAWMGLITAVFMVLASASSGPAASFLVSAGALYAWRFRAWVRYVPLLVAVGYVALELVMSRPAYYLISRIDLAGGSTGWHRSHLIHAAITHLDEWWFIGTDYTRHWMPTGITWSSDHTDITNYYLVFGVWAGVPALLLFVAIIWTAFHWVGQTVREHRNIQLANRYLAWCLGAGLFSHAAASIAVAYYDQSFVFFWLNVAAIGSVCAPRRIAPGIPRHAVPQASPSPAEAGAQQRPAESPPPRPEGAPDRTEAH